MDEYGDADEEINASSRFSKRKRKPLSWAEKLERQTARLEKKTPEQLQSYSYNLSIWYLSQKDYTSFELRQKMLKKLVPEEVIDVTITRLTEISAIDDNSYAERYTESALKFKKWSSSKVRRELAHKRIETDLIDQALEDVYSEDLEWEAACSLASAKVKATRSTADIKKRENKIIRALMSRGFAYDIASRAMKEALDESSN